MIDPQPTTDETHKAEENGNEAWNETEDIPADYFEPQGDPADQDSSPPSPSEDDANQNAGDS